MIVCKTSMDAIPANCLECKFYGCSLPLKANGVDVLKSCWTKRHRDCPLVEVEGPTVTKDATH